MYYRKFIKVIKIFRYYGIMYFFCVFFVSIFKVYLKDSKSKQGKLCTIFMKIYAIIIGTKCLNY